MGRKSKYSQDVKMGIVREYLEKNISSTELAKRYGCDDNNILYWVSQYKSQGGSRIPVYVQSFPQDAR